MKSEQKFLKNLNVFLQKVQITFKNFVIKHKIKNITYSLF